MKTTKLRIGLTSVILIAGVHLPAADNAAPNVPPPDKILATLRPGHPRIMATPKSFDDLRNLVAQGGLPATIYAEVRKSAGKILTAPVSKYEKPDGRRLLSVKP